MRQALVVGVIGGGLYYNRDLPGLIGKAIFKEPWQATCYEARSALQDTCRGGWEFAPGVYDAAGLTRPNNRELCHWVAKQGCRHDAAPASVFVTGGVAYTESLQLGKPPSGAQMLEAIDKAVEASKHQRVSIVAERHFTTSSNLFRERILNQTSMKGDILLLEGSFLGQWFAGTSPTVAHRGDKNFSKYAVPSFIPGSFGGLEEPNTRFRGVPTFVLSENTREARQTFLEDVQGLPNALGADVVVTLLQRLASPVAPLSKGGKRLAQIVEKILRDNGDVTESLFEEAQGISPEAWHHYLKHIEQAMDAFAVSEGDQTLERLQRSGVNSPLAVMSARALWPRDRSFARSIQSVRTQHPNRNVVAIVGAAHAQAVRRFVDSLPMN